VKISVCFGLGEILAVGIKDRERLLFRSTPENQAVRGGVLSACLAPMLGEGLIRRLRNARPSAFLDIGRGDTLIVWMGNVGRDIK
jgi:hypothetical protein